MKPEWTITITVDGKGVFYEARAKIAVPPQPNPAEFWYVVMQTARALVRRIGAEKLLLRKYPKDDGLFGPGEQVMREAEEAPYGGPRVIIETSRLKRRKQKDDESS